MYPITNVKYRDAKRCRVYEFDPARDIIILDTSALGFDHSAAYETFIRAKGTFIIPESVAQEITNHSDLRRFNSGRLSTAKASDTRSIRRLSYNGPIISQAVTETWGKPMAVPITNGAAKEQAYLDRVAKLLPKHHAYCDARSYFASWHTTFRTIADHQEQQGNPLSLDELRGAEAYRILERVLHARLDQPKELSAKVETLQRSNVALREKYEHMLASNLTALAPAVTEGVRSGLCETLAESYADTLDTVLVRTLGNALDPRYARSPEDSAHELRARFPTTITATDADVVLLGYVLPHAPNKNVHLLAHDIDIRHLLHIRKVLNGAE